jgi:hypothetical protein
MTALSDNLLKEIRQRIAPIIAISPIQKHDPVADSTISYSIRTAKEDLFLLISNAVSPLMVNRAIDRQREIRSHLTGAALDPIEVPLFEGYLGEQSYAIWRSRLPLSTNRLVSRIQRTFLAPRVFSWLKDIARQTAAPADPSNLAANTLRLQRIPTMPAFIKAAAEEAGDAFRSGRTPAIQVAQHGDLWIGNVLKAPFGFVVIDWPGARMDGSPFFDLTKFALSIGASKTKLNREVSLMSKILGCHMQDAPAYVLSGLGALYAELEHFPEQRFLELCRQKISALNVALNLD